MRTDEERQKMQDEARNAAVESAYPMTHRPAPISLTLYPTDEGMWFDR